MLFNIIVGGNLSTDLLRVLDEGLTFVFLDFTFLSFNLFLFLDLTHVVLTFNTSLLSQIYLLLIELSLSGLLKIGGNTLSLFMLKLLTKTSLSLTLLKGTFGSKSVNFSLSIGSLLLKFSELLDLTFLLILKSLGFKLSFVLLLVLSTLIGDDGLLLVLFLLSTFLLLE